MAPLKRIGAMRCSNVSVSLSVTTTRRNNTCNDPSPLSRVSSASRLATTLRTFRKMRKLIAASNIRCTQPRIVNPPVANVDKNDRTRSHSLSAQPLKLSFAPFCPWVHHEPVLFNKPQVTRRSNHAPLLPLSPLGWPPTSRLAFPNPAALGSTDQLQPEPWGLRCLTSGCCWPWSHIVAVSTMNGMVAASHAIRTSSPGR